MAALPGVHVPMCEQCNTHLNSFIEAPAKDLVRKLIPWNEPHEWPEFDTRETLAVALWLLKIGLLTTHPEAVNDNPKVQRKPGSTYFEDACLGWMRKGEIPPEGFSVFVTRRLVSGEVSPPAEELELAIPSVIVDGIDLHYMFRNFGIRGLEVTIVWHPGWPILHPLVEAGRAAQLWPGAPAVNFSSLPDVHPHEFRFVDSRISPIQVSMEEFQKIVQDPLSIESD